MDARMRKAERNRDSERLEIEQRRAGIIPSPEALGILALVLWTEEEGRLLYTQQRCPRSIPGYEIVGDRWDEQTERWVCLWRFRGMSDEELEQAERRRESQREEALKAELNRSFEKRSIR